MEEAKKVFALPPNEKEKLVIDETSQNYYKGKIRFFLFHIILVFYSIMKENFLSGYLGMHEPLNWPGQLTHNVYLGVSNREKNLARF